MRIIVCLLFFLAKSAILSAQTLHLGGGLSYYNNYLFNKDIEFVGDDSVYVFSGAMGGGLMGAFYFDYGGYYYRKMFGIKTELNFSRIGQSYKVYPGAGAANPEVFYRFRTRLDYLDVPLLFNFCPTHHQGFTLDVGPQISFLRNANVVAEESRVENPNYPVLTKQDFRPITYSGVIGIGCFYNFTESFAMIGTFRTGYTFSDIRLNNAELISYSPTKRFWAGAYIMGIYKFNKYYSDRNRGYKYYLKRLKKN
jgi:hypothetical protein